MPRHFTLPNPGAGHPLRRRLPRPHIVVEAPVVEAWKGPREDIAFFLVSFASAFVILYGFVIS